MLVKRGDDVGPEGKRTRARRAICRCRRRALRLRNRCRGGLGPGERGLVGRWLVGGVGSAYHGDGLCMGIDWGFGGE